MFRGLICSEKWASKPQKKTRILPRFQSRLHAALTSFSVLCSFLFLPVTAEKSAAVLGFCHCRVALMDWAQLRFQFCDKNKTVFGARPWRTEEVGFMSFSRFQTHYWPTFLLQSSLCSGSAATPVCSSLIHPIEDLGNPNKPASIPLRAPELWNYPYSVVIYQQSWVLHFLTWSLPHGNVTRLLKSPLKSLIRADWINSDSIYSAPPSRGGGC